MMQFTYNSYDDLLNLLKINGYEDSSCCVFVLRGRTGNDAR